MVPFVIIAVFVLSERLCSKNNYAINNVICGIVAFHMIAEVLVVRQYLKWLQYEIGQLDENKYFDDCRKSWNNYNEKLPKFSKKA